MSLLTKTHTHSAWLQTAGVTSIDLLDPQPEQISIDTIAHALGHIPRFNGQTDHFYPVAGHAVQCSYYVERELKGSPQEAMEALMHDSAEAFVGDMPTPLKRLLPEFSAIEDRIFAVIAAKFGLEGHMSATTKLADEVMLATEAHALFKELLWVPQQRPHSGYPVLYGHTPGFYRVRFLQRFKELEQQRGV